MPIPDYQTLMLPVLQLAAQGERRVGEVAEAIADAFGLRPDEREEMLPSGRQRMLHNRIHWAKFYMSKAGLIVAPARGRFVATEAGRTVLAGNPARIDTAFLMREPAFRAFYRNEGAAAGGEAEPPPTVPGPALAPDEDVATPQERIEAAYQEFHVVLRDDLLQRIAQNSPTFFEGLIVDLLVAMGYGGSHKNAAARLGRSGDGGIDGVIDEDRLGLDRVYVPAKRYAAKTTVGRPEIQGFVGSLGAGKGVFVTTSSFSAQARDFVRHLSQRAILLDGPTLADLMIEHGVCVRTVQTVALKRLDEDFFAEEG